MKVIMIYNYDPSNLRGGGGITYVHNLIKGLLDKFIEVTLLGVNLTENRTFSHPNFDFIPLLNGSDNWYKFFFNLRSNIKNLKISNSDIIHAHHPLIMYPFLKNFPENPKVLTLHGVPLDMVKLDYPYMHKFTGLLYKPIEKKVLNSVNKVVTASDYTRNRLIKRYPELKLSNKICSIPSSIDINKFKPMDKNFLKTKYNLDRFETILIFVGRLATIKNPDLLLKSFSLFKKEFKSSALVIVGKGTKENVYRDITKKLNLKNVLFFGEADLEKVSELLNCSDALLLTSWYESSPTVIKEALSCGIPVVTTNVGDVKNVITNEYLGKIVNSYDEIDYSDSLINVIDLVKDSPEKVKNNCHQRAYQFSFENTVSQYIDQYIKIIR